jgi:putative ABC transport system permease protein|tara:strand:- start:247 stop:1536 length:1290 start_codon:yes stop_codon:yes gene_type:complete
MRAVRKLFLELWESIRIAIEQLRAHILRSILTALGVIIGVWAVILMGVLVSGLNDGIKSSLSLLGSDLFYIEKFPWRDVGDDWMKFRNRTHLEASYAEELNQMIAQNPRSDLFLAAPTVAHFTGLQRDNLSIDNVIIFGTTAAFNLLGSNEVEHGRFFSEAEALSGQNLTLLGSEVAEALFPEGREHAVGQVISLSKIKFTVLGVFAEQGDFLGMQSWDRNAVMPLSSMRKFFVGSRRRDTTSIRVLKKPEADREVARDEVIGAMRRIRGLLPGEEEDFEVNSSDMIEDQLGRVTGVVAMAGLGITSLSLFVGAIGIMNITFVSVRERTQEIGTRRAVGARRVTILLQFLVEAAFVSLIGGAIGLGLAKICQLGIEAFLGTKDFYFSTSLSPELVAFAVIISVCTGIAAGFVPAWLASRMDPANALRHE